MGRDAAQTEDGRYRLLVEAAQTFKTITRIPMRSSCAVSAAPTRVIPPAIHRDTASARSLPNPLDG